MNPYSLLQKLKESTLQQFSSPSIMNQDAQQARFLRKRHAQEGLDEEQQLQQRQFGQNLQKALDVHGKKDKKQDIESQVQYFGHMIEPFNMRQEEDMGDIDQEGFFVFKRRNQYRDPWLDSIEEANDMMVADKVKKKLKTEGTGWRGVYDDGRDEQNGMQKINEDESQKDEDSKSQYQNQQQPQDADDEDKNQMSLEPNQIKKLICQILPMNKSANNYIKQLKKKIKDPESKELHDKILELCNIYIEKTNEYDILTSKKEQLEAELDEGDEQKSEELNWDDEEHSAKESQRNEKNCTTSGRNQKDNDQIKQSANKANRMQQKYENDDIF